MIREEVGKRTEVGIWVGTKFAPLNHGKKYFKFELISFPLLHLDLMIRLTKFVLIIY